MRERSGVGGAKRIIRCSAVRAMVVGEGVWLRVVSSRFQTNIFENARLRALQRSCLRDRQNPERVAGGHQNAELKFSFWDTNAHVNTDKLRIQLSTLVRKLTVESTKNYQHGSR